MTRLAASVAAVFALATPSTFRAEEAKPADGSKGSEFKSKAYDLQDKGETSVALTFEGGKEVTVTTAGPEGSDINLHVEGTYYEARDTSPAPECLVKFAPAKGDAKFTPAATNKSPGANKVTLAFKVAD